MRDDFPTLQHADDERPSVDDTDALAMHAELERRLFGSVSGEHRTKTMGRFEITGRLGSGANGNVYRAIDPTLDRTVALKVLRPDVALPPDAGERLKREAVALAALSHPNVVALFDVGIEGGAVYVVMELVDGEDLAAWLAGRRRSWRELVRVFAEVADGLAAVHERGMSHRDIKPANILIDHTGRPRVADFGLASVSAALPVMDGDDCPLPSLGATLTRSGLVVGTPAYMAPEQHRSSEVGPAADQFAFFVTLFEALAGMRPYRGTSWADLFAAKRKGMPELPATVEAPRALIQSIGRGLAPDPDDRFESMAAVAAALRRLASRRRRPALATAVAAVAVGAAVLWAARPPEAGSCAAASTRAGQAWRGRAPSVAEAFGAIAVPYAEDTFARVDQRLERWSQDWEREYLAACHAQDEDRQSSRATNCLERLEADFAATIDLLAGGGPEIVDAAVATVHRLAPPTSCASGDLPAAYDRDVAASVRAQLTKARELGELGLVERARTHLERAQRLGGDAFRLDVDLERARLELSGGPAAAGLKAMEVVAWDAVAAGRDDVAVDAMLTMASTILHGAEASADDAERWLREAESRLSEAPAPLAEIRWRISAGQLAMHRGDLRTARSHAQWIVDLPPATLPEDSTRRTAAMANLGELLRLEGDLDASLELHTRVLEISKRALGPRHPTVGVDLTNLGATAHDAGQIELARALFEEALSILEPVRGPDHADIGVLRGHLGNLALQAGRFAEAQGYFEQMLETYERVLGDDDPRTAGARSNVAYALALQGEHERAIGMYRDAAATIAASGESPDFAVTCLTRMASSLTHVERFEDAAAAYRDARDLALALGLGGSELAGAWTGVGRMALQRHDPTAAIAAFSEVLALRRDAAPGRRGLAHVNLAIAYEAAGRTEEARDHATQALSLLEDSPLLQAPSGVAAVSRILTRLSPR